MLYTLQGFCLFFARHMIPTNKRGAVTIALGKDGLAQLRAAAKRANTNQQALPRL
jgi:hypothetical protein